VCERWQESHREKLPQLLMVLSSAVIGLERVIEMSPRVLNRWPEMKAFWTEGFQRLLAETLEIFEEGQETIALELSSNFHREIDQAREEAGIEADVPGKMRTL